LSSHRRTYEDTGKTLAQFDLNNSLIFLKQQKTDMTKIYAQVLQNISKRIKDGYTNFFARRKAGLKAGLPRFKKIGQYKSITYPQYGFKVVGNKLCLSKIGDIKIRLHRPLRGQTKTLTIKQRPSGKWYAVFSCVVETQSKEKPHKDIGIDVGLNTYATLSDETRIENPRLYRKSEKKLAKLQKTLSRKKKGSNNRNKARIKVAQLHEKTENRRTDFLHKASRNIVDTYGTVYVEDLKIHDLVKNHCLAKSISDAGWNTFTYMISYKAENAGGRLVKVDPRNTTQNCSQCGERVEKTLSDRTHDCPHCGLVMDRDLNAALNILARGREIGRGPPEYTPVGEETNTQFSVVEQAASMNQEVSLPVGR